LRNEYNGSTVRSTAYSLRRIEFTESQYESEGI
jgi:hypothetical protein